MSRNLINGYSSVINRYNLSTNGNFIINQRGLFATWTPANVGDFLCDCWYVDSCDIDYLEATTVNDNIRLRGHGKKGQSIFINNMDNQPLGRMDQLLNPSDYSFGTITGAVSAWCIDTSPSVPLLVGAYPRYNTAGDTVLLNEQVVVKGTGVNDVKTAVDARLTRYDSFDERPKMFVQLQADGEFYVILQNYRELPGAFRNPPTVTPVPYADNLVRCQRYYQTGSWNTQGVRQLAFPITSWSTILRAVRWVQFTTQMQSSPSISVSIDSPSLLIFHTPSGTGNDPSVSYATFIGSESGVMSASDVKTNGFNFYLNWSNSYHNTAVSVALGNITWTAEIT